MQPDRTDWIIERKYQAYVRDGGIELYTFERESERYSHWFDEKNCLQRIPVSVEVSNDSKQ